MEQTEQFDTGTANNPNYWPSVGVSAIIFGFVAFLVSIIGGYIVINGGSGSLFSTIMQSAVGIVSCLIAAFGGMLAVWHYARTYGITMKLGKGALIGFFTGVGVVLVSIIFQELWYLIDPEFNQKMIQAVIHNIEAMDMPDQQKQQIIDSTAQSMKSNIGKQLLWGLPITGILNLLTGMLGVSLFARKKEEI